MIETITIDDEDELLDLAMNAIEDDVAEEEDYYTVHEFITKIENKFYRGTYTSETDFGWNVDSTLTRVYPHEVTTIEYTEHE